MIPFEMRTLEKVAILLSGGTPSKAKPSLWNGEVPWLTPKDMGCWAGRTEKTVTAEAIGSGTRLAPAHASYAAVRGMSLHNEIRVIYSRIPLTFNQDIKAIVAKEGVEPRFLYFALVAAKPQLLNWVSAAGHGTGVLSTDRLKSALVPDVSVAEQEAISSVLGALDDKIELNRRMSATLEAMARAIFKDWFVDFGPTRRQMEGATDPTAIMGHAFPPEKAGALAPLFPDRLVETEHGEVPEGWEVKPLSEVAEFLNGLALQKYSASYPADSLPVIKIAELRNGVTAKSDRASRDVPDKYIVKDGDFLFSWSGSLLAKFWTEGEGALNQHLFKVTSNRYPAWFYAEWVQMHLEEFKRIAAFKATTMGHIQRGHLQAAMTNCPPDDVLECLGQVISPLVQRAIQVELESRTLAALRDLLLPKLISGEVRVKDTEKHVREAT